MPMATAMAIRPPNARDVGFLDMAPELAIHDYMFKRLLVIESIIRNDIFPGEPCHGNRRTEGLRGCRPYWRHESRRWRVAYRTVQRHRPYPRPGGRTWLRAVRTPQPRCSADAGGRAAVALRPPRRVAAGRCSPSGSG